jgi:UrcA family protein
MYTNTAAMSTRCLLGAAAVACTLLAASAAAEDRSVIVAIPVHGQGLDLSQPAGARELYMRLEYAAYVACTRGDRVGLAPSSDARACSAKALANAIRSANVPLLTQTYLARHPLSEALAHGIDVPAQIAAK